MNRINRNTSTKKFELSTGLISFALGLLLLGLAYQIDAYTKNKNASSEMDTVRYTIYKPLF